LFNQMSGLRATRCPDGCASHRARAGSRERRLEELRMFAPSRVAAGIAVACSIIVIAQGIGRAANDVVVHKGTLVFAAGGTGHLDVSGTDSFSLVADVALPGGVFAGYSRCLANECVPGTLVDLDATWFGIDLQGNASLKSATYDDVGALNGASSAQIAFSGTVTMPAMSSSVVTITVPFSFNGFFAYSLNRSGAQSAMLTGRGSAVLRLRPSTDRVRWYFDQVVFQFESGKSNHSSSVIG